MLSLRKIAGMPESNSSISACSLSRIFKDVSSSGRLDLSFGHYLASATRMNQLCFLAFVEHLEKGMDDATAFAQVFKGMRSDPAKLDDIGKRLSKARFDHPTTAISFILLWRFLVESGRGATSRITHRDGFENMMSAWNL